MWWMMLLDALIARAEWGAAGAVVACIATNCGGADKPKDHHHPAQQIVIPAGDGDECRTDLTANGHVFHDVLLDSGATGSRPLVFGRNHARALGFEPRKLDYRYTYSSANGDGYYAKVTVRSMRLQGFTMRNVPAQITEVDQSQPLIGAGILHKLNFQLNDGNCVLSVPPDSAMRMADREPTPAAPEPVEMRRKAPAAPMIEEEPVAPIIRKPAGTIGTGTGGLY